MTFGGLDVTDIIRNINQNRKYTKLYIFIMEAAIVILMHILENPSFLLEHHLKVTLSKFVSKGQLNRHYMIVIVTQNMMTCGSNSL